MHAKSALILSHMASGMGERSLAYELQRLLTKGGYHAHPIIDLVELLGEKFEPFARLNYALAEADHSLLDTLAPPPALPASDLTLVLSWNFGLAALLATGLHTTRPLALKLSAHHPDERILPSLYQHASLILTESPLGSERALTYGLNPGKVLLLQNTYPAKAETLPLSRTYVERLAETQGKKLSASARVIGCVDRLEYGKNCEFALEAVRRLQALGEEIVLVLKGDFPEESPYPLYRERFSAMLAAYAKEPWFLWDREWTPYPSVLEEYQSFDLLLHLSGAEGGSHVVTECLGLQKPVILLGCSTNPSLFKGVATFVETEGERVSAQLPFHRPSLSHLMEVLAGPWRRPDPEKVKKRFHEEALQAKIPLLFDPDPQILKELHAHDYHLFSH